MVKIIPDMVAVGRLFSGFKTLEERHLVLKRLRSQKELRLNTIGFSGL